MKSHLSIDLPSQLKSRASSGALFDKAYLAVLALVCNRPAPPETTSRIYEDEYGQPLRHVFYGDQSYGLELRGEGIYSGVGVHGEAGDWSFYGLPEGVTLSGSSRLDMRSGTSNWLSLSLSIPDEDLAIRVQDSFAEDLKNPA